MKKLLIILPIFVLICGLGFVVFSSSNDDETSDQQAADANVESSQITIDSDNSAPKYKFLSGNEYKTLFLNSSHPNTKKIINPPPIFGDPVADNWIQRLALDRGYELQETPKTTPPTLGSVILQQKLIDDWRKLAEVAKGQGIELEIRSGLRTVEEQSQLFSDALIANSITAELVKSGQANESLNNVLANTAPPGYSRHHSGYTIDIADKSATVFEYSDGFEWISANNYLNAKKHGFIPSYPDGATDQGPDPEAWEYVWVSKQLLLEN